MLKNIYIQKKELQLAQKFSDLNGDYYGIQRVDFLKLENGSLLLTEIEDISPYLDLDCLENSEINKFIDNYKIMVYDYFKKYNHSYKKNKHSLLFFLLTIIFSYYLLYQYL